MEKTKNGKVNKALMMGTALISLSGLDASQAQAATGAVAMTAEVLTPIVVSSTVPLVFGSLTVAALTAGTLVVGPVTVGPTPGGAGGATPAGSVLTPAAGVIRVAGNTGVNIDLAVTTTSDTVVNGTAQTMVVDNFNLITDAGGTTATVTFGASPGLFPVGATLNVTAGQAIGTYTGSFNVSAAYQ